MKPNFEAIVKSFSPGAELISAEVLPGGYSAEVYVLKIQSNKKQSRVVLRAEGSPRSENKINTEYDLLKVLSRSNLPVADPIFCDISKKNFSKPFMVMSFLEGEVQEKKILDEEWIKSIANLQQDVRSVNITPLPKLPIRIDPLENIFKFLPKEDEWKNLRAFLKRTEGLAYKGKNTFLHGDFWPGNILWVNNRITGLLDWEYAAVGDPISDIAVTCLELRYNLGKEGVKAFLEFSSCFVDIDSKRLAFWLIYVASSTLTYIHEWNMPKEREGIMISEAKETIRESFILLSQK